MEWIAILTWAMLVSNATLTQPPIQTFSYWSCPEAHPYAEALGAACLDG